MPTFEFQDFEFKEEKDKVRVTFLKLFYFDIDKAKLADIGDYKLEENKITFKDISEKTASNKFNNLLTQGFSELKNSLNNHKTIYIHKNSGIPLIGSLSFGIIDRGSNMLELKPMTSCNINCTYCSVDEGLSTKKVFDYVVEKDYLVDETRKLVEFKRKKDNIKLNIYINPHGEPLLYADIVELVHDLRQINGIDEIHIITNGALLTEELIDNIIEAGLTHLNISISALEEKKAKILAGTAKYDIEHIKKMIDYSKDRIKVIITPVYLQGMNENDIEDIIKYAKPKGITVMIQNFLENKRGRTPVKQKSWPEFFSFLKELEKKYDVKLIKQAEAVKIIKTEELPVPFRHDEIIKAEVVAPGRYAKESLAVAGNRAITVLDHPFEGHKTIKIKIIHTKNNIMTAKSC
ncbi:MAG: radical SAM protein [Nanoarchaeota archaeon]|nr:radical SAM protein [Nanoarchaeota archaeon]